MANDHPRADARSTTHASRLTGQANQGLAPAGDRTAKGGRGKGATPVETRPLLLVGKLGELMPSALAVGAHQDGSGPTHLVRTDQVDFRKAKGFDRVLESSLSQLGYPVAQGAEVKAVNSNDELLRAARGAGSRQVIYFGHAAGPGALWPGGIDAQPVDRAALEKAFAGGGPRPIFLGCNAAGLPLIGAPPPANAIGLDRILSLDNLSATLTSPDVRTVTARDIKVTGIDLSVGAKGYAPQAPLPTHEAITPP
jgi:hypothetical protein